MAVEATAPPLQHCCRVDRSIEHVSCWPPLLLLTLLWVKFVAQMSKAFFAARCAAEREREPPAPS
eukprot:5736196-Prymnesium_polylepis.1